jgi:hypothetical protein
MAWNMLKIISESQIKTAWILTTETTYAMPEEGFADITKCPVW